MPLQPADHRPPRPRPRHRAARRRGCRPSPPASCAAASSSGAAPRAPSTGGPTACRRTPTPSTGWARSPRPSSRCACCGCATPAGSTSPTGSATHVPGSALDDVSHRAAAHPRRAAPRPRRPGRGGSARRAATGTPWSPQPVGQRFRAGRRFHYSNVGYAALGRLLEVHHGRGWFDVVRDELLEPLGHDPHDHAPVGVRGAGAGGAPVRRRAAARARARRRGDGAGRAAVDDRRRPRPLGDLPRWCDRTGCCRPTPSPRWSSRTTSSTTRGSRGSAAHGLGFQVWNVGRRPVRRPRRLDARLPRRAPGAAGCRCAGGSPASGAGWPRCHGSRPGRGSGG